MRRAWWSPRRFVFVVIIVNDNDFLGNAILVEGGPVGFLLPIVHFGGGAGGERGQLLGLPMSSSGPTQIRIGGVTGVAAVECVGYAVISVCELSIGRGGVVCLMVRIELVMGRKRGRGRGGCRHISA